MKGFEFKLKKVLKVRNLREEMARNDLIQAHRRVRETKYKLEQMDQKQKELYDFLRGGDRSLETSIQARNYLHFHREKINQVKEKLAGRKQEADHCQQKFVDRHKKSQVLEKLREKEYNKFYREFLFKEQKELDEIGQLTGSQAGGIR